MFEAIVEMVNSRPGWSYVIKQSTRHPPQITVYNARNEHVLTMIKESDFVDEPGIDLASFA